MIRIEYQLNYEEWVEAARLQVRVRMWAAIIVGSVISTIILLPPPSATAMFGFGVLEPILMWVAIFAVVWVAAFLTLRRAGSRPWRRKSRRIGPVMPAWFRRFLVPAAALMLTGWIIRLRWQYEFAEARSNAVSTGTPFSEAGTFIATVIIIASSSYYSVVPSVVAIFTRKGGIFGWPYAQGWKTQPQIRRPMTAEFSEIGCVISEPLSRHEYHWDYFPGWAETPNLFVLYITNRSIHILPKRAFASDTQRIEFVQLIERHISEALPAFPVQPVNASEAVS